MVTPKGGFDGARNAIIGGRNRVCFRGQFYESWDGFDLASCVVWWWHRGGRCVPQIQRRQAREARTLGRRRLQRLGFAARQLPTTPHEASIPQADDL